MPESKKPEWMSRFKVILLAPVFVLIALLCWAFASPVGSSPDDDFHLASIWCANGLNTDACQPGPEANERVVPEGLLEAPLCYRFLPATSAECINDVDFDPTHTETTVRGSFSGNYPPVFYAVMSIFVGPDIVASVLLMRAVNILVLLGMVSALYVLLPIRLRPTLLWPFIISVVPLGVFVLASNNPSAWALVGIGTIWLSLIGYFETVGKRRIALGALFVLSVVMTAGARADAAVYAAISIAVALFLTFRRDRSYLLQAILPVLLVPIALVFYFSSGQSAVASQGLGSIEDLGPARGLSELFLFNILNLVDLYAGMFGTWGLGWLDVFLPPLVPFLASIVFIGLVFTGLRRTWARKTIAFAGVAAVLVLLPFYVLYKGNNFVGEVLQPRYLLPLMLLLAGVALLPAGRAVLRLSRVQAVLVILALSVANSAALHANIRRYVTGQDVRGLNLNAGIEWWWSGAIVSPMALWAIGTVAFGAAVTVLVWELGRRTTAPVTFAATPALPDRAQHG